MNAVTVIVGDVEVVAEKLLGWLGKAGKVVSKAEAVEPQVVAALATVFGAINQSVSDVKSDATAPSILLTQQTWQDLQAVWPDVKAFASTLGIKI